MKWPLQTTLIEHEDDVAAVRQRARGLAERIGFSAQDQVRFATAVSEIARNTHGYAGGGKAEFGVDLFGARQMLVVRISDKGPGIADLGIILDGRYRSTTGLGLGITGARRLVDRFDIQSDPASGTVVSLGKTFPAGHPTVSGPDLAALGETLDRDRALDLKSVLREQNRELMRSLGALAEREDETRRLNTELAARAEALRIAGETLEQQVAERTADLARANAKLRAEAIERARVEDNLRQAQKMEAVGQLTGSIAHDFNNLLTIIRSSTDLLRRPSITEDKRRRYVDAISDTVDRAAKLTGQLLAFARRQPLQPEIFDVAASLLAVSDMLKTIVGARITIQTHVPEMPLFVEADVSQFETALVNLAVNARDAMAGAGKLTLHVEASASVPPIRGHGEAIGDFVEIAVGDTGSGIPHDVIAQIFEPFFTTKGVGKGTGLGLSQVFGFAKQSGGNVDLRSEMGCGTTFTLYLPRVAHETAPSPKASSRHAPIDGAGCHVLVVEDNIGVGTFSTGLLEDLGYGTTWAANAEEALVHLTRNPDRFDVVFSDVVMPGLGGIELGHIIRARWPTLSVILTSGYSEILAAEPRHGFPLLQKPYSVEALSRILRGTAAP